MQTILLPNTTLTVSVIALGTADLGTKIDRDLSFDLLDAFLAAGGNFIDTAAVYSDWIPGERRRVEKLLGEWISSRKNRDRIILATKGAHPELATMQISRMTKADIVKDIEASLRQLNTDRLDLFWLHRDDRSKPVEAIIDPLNEQVKAGSIRYFGASNWTTERLRAANDYAQTSSQQGFVGNQMLWNVGVPELNMIPDKTVAAMDGAMWRYHVESGLAAIPYTAQAGGYFNKVAEGRIDPQSQLARVYGGSTNEAIAGIVQQIAQQRGWTITQVALGYLLAQPFVTVPIVGCRSLAQLNDSLAAIAARLSDEEMQRLNQARES